MKSVYLSDKSFNQMWLSVSYMQHHLCRCNVVNSF